MIELPEDARDVLTTWFGTDALDEPSPLHQRRWFVRDDAFDAELSQRFLPLLTDVASDGAGESSWEATALGALARVILLDQFPRNLFRDDARTFATDPLARAVAERAITRGFDGIVPILHASFFYLPFEHSESLVDQDRAVALFQALAARAPAHLAATAANLVVFAEKHQAVIRRFGRFPHRNAVLGRANTREEDEFLQAGRGF
jgi:uncharacterized protein (DUF924 family)